MLQFYTYYYGGMFSCSNRNLHAGCDVNEWELISNAPHRPQPLPGYGGNGGTETFNTELSLAKSYGIDGFIINFYHNGSWVELAAPINSFRRQQAVQFALNWCYRMPRRVLPVPLAYEHKQTKHIVHTIVEEGKNIATELTAGAVEEIIAFAAGNCFSDEQYIKINGRCYFSIYHVTGLLRQYGADGVNEIIKMFRKAAAHHGFKLHLVGLLSVTPEDEEYNELIRDTDFDALSAYCALPDFKSPVYKQDYAKLFKSRIAEWPVCAHLYKKPFYPCAAAGWDASVRGAAGYDPEIHGLIFPWAPVVVNDRPEHFSAFVDAARNYACGNAAHEQIVLLGPWNEWSEGAYLLPDTKHGFQKLEAVKAVKERIS